jgi:hypothetical protein
MSVRARLVVLLIGMLPLAATALAQPSDGPRLVVAVSAGLDRPFSSFNSEVETSGLFGTERVFEHSYNDVFTPALVLGADVGAAFGRRQVVARVRFAHANGRSTAFGESINRFPPDQRLNVAQFSDYRALEFEGSFRYALRGGSGVTPFVGVAGGLTVVDEVRSTYYCQFGVAECTLTAGSTVPAVAGLAGLSFPVSPHVAIEAEAGFRWQMASTEDVTELRVGFIKDDFGRVRISIPIGAGIRFRF